MKTGRGYSKKPLDFTRKMVIASLRNNKRNAIHCITKVDVSEPIKLKHEISETGGEKISLTTYIVKCFAESLRAFPEMNSFIKGRNLIFLEDINISVMIERESDGVKFPEPLGLQKVQEKSLLIIHQEIKEAKAKEGEEIGNLSDSTWIKLIPGFLLNLFIKIAERNITMAKRYGKVAVTSVGMFSESATWFVPHGTATVLLTVGSISKEIVSGDNGEPEIRDFLNITASFDHEIIDGAPAARFMTHFSNILKRGDFLRDYLTKTDQKVDI